MTFGDSMPTDHTTHATLVFEREIHVPIKKVFSAIADAKARSEWARHQGVAPFCCKSLQMVRWTDP